MVFFFLCCLSSAASHLLTFHCICCSLLLPLLPFHLLIFHSICCSLLLLLFISQYGRGSQPAYAKLFVKLLMIGWVFQLVILWVEATSHTPFLLSHLLCRLLCYSMLAFCFNPFNMLMICFSIWTHEFITNRTLKWDLKPPVLFQPSLMKNCCCYGLQFRVSNQAAISHLSSAVFCLSL